MDQPARRFGASGRDDAGDIHVTLLICTLCSHFITAANSAPPIAAQPGAEARATRAIRHGASYHDDMDPREAVTNNDDLFAAILRQLCARQLCSAARLCHAHHSLVASLLSERDFLQVTLGPSLKDRPEKRHLALTERLRPATVGASLGLPPRCSRWRSGGYAATWEPPAMPGVHEDAPGIFLSSTELVVPGAAQHDCTPFLTALLARFPGLSSLSLDLCQTAPHASGDAVARREGALHGPSPLSLFPLCGGITDLRIKDAAGHEALLLQAMVSFRRTLLRLDVSGLGGLALPALLTAGLDQLLLLRVGECRDSSPHPSVRAGDFPIGPWPAGVTVDEIGGALPSLTALDVGFAECRPVNIVDLQRLLIAKNDRNVHLRHLDLSQVMAYMDFDPAVYALAEGAPQLESLAIFGLHVSDDALRTLGQMSQLSTCHLVACSNHTAAGLALFLESAAKLRQIDLSFGLAPVESLRQVNPKPNPIPNPNPNSNPTLTQP